MGCILTTFAHGNGPFSRNTEWAIEVNNVIEERGMHRLPVIVPLVYPGRQERITKEEIENNVSQKFLTEHPYEILFDEEYGKLLNEIMFKGNDYAENLKLLYHNYNNTENKIQEHLNGKRKFKTFNSEVVELDLRDSEFQLGLNNRVQTGLLNQFYTAGGAGPFDEVLERAIINEEIKLDKEVMKKVLPITKRMIENQK